MNQIMARSAVPFAGASSVRSVQSPANLRFRQNPLPQPLPASLPLVDSGVGNLFLDRNNANLHWYLPAFALVADPDPSFAFVASQSSQQQANGQPFNVARLTLRISKFRPADVVQFAQGNPGAILQEIPLTDNMTAVLSSFYTDQGGQQQQRTFNATSLQVQSDGSILLTFDSSILGDCVIGLYQDLRVFGKAVINLSASYQAWVTQGTLPPPSNLRVRMLAVPVSDLAVAGAAPQPPSPPVRIAADVGRFNTLRTFSPGIQKSGNVVANPAGTPSFVELRQSWGEALPLGLKYNVDGYQLKYTVSTATVASQVILNAADLSTFNLSQTEFVELKALGMISLRYPTLSCAYLGALSRAIVVIPRRYSIVRGKAGCAATCLARVDSSPASGSQCSFEFSFTIAPDVSRIELQKLQQEVLNNSDLKDCHLTFPDFECDSPPSTLLTTFKSSAQFAAGADAHTFAVTVSVQDDGADTPAVADANLFILRLCSQTGADLIGSLRLKLDDGYPDPVLATVDLNFLHTVGTDELDVEFDEAGAVIKVTNQSPLDLQLTDYALIQGSSLTGFPGVINIAAGGTASLPLPANHTGLEFAADAQLVVPTPMSMSAVASFLNFKTVDVQQTQYVVAIDGSGVNFKRVTSIAVNITFTTLPDVIPRTLQLNQNVHADSTHIVIPLENAVFSLPGSVNLTVQFVDSAVNTLTFTMQNEFTSQPVLILLQGDIDKNLPKT